MEVNLDVDAHPRQHVEQQKCHVAPLDDVTRIDEQQIVGLRDAKRSRGVCWTFCSSRVTLCKSVGLSSRFGVSGVGLDQRDRG